MPIPELSIIICHHAGSLILRCLKSLETAKGNFECIIVTSMREFSYQGSGITLIYADGGPAYKRNLGASSASGKYLVFLDDDVEIREDCLINFQAFLESKPACGMAFAKILKMDRRDVFDDCGSWLTWTGFLWSRAGNDQIDRKQYDDPIPILASKSATCIISKQVFSHVGQFDEEMYILGEETDLAWRCWHAGYQVWYVPSAVSWHAFGTSLKPPAEYYKPDRIYKYGPRNYITLLYKNLGATRLLLTLPIHLFGWLCAATIMALTGRRSFSILILLGIWENIANFKRLHAKRKIVQAARKVSDWQLSKFIYSSPPPSYYLARLIRYRTTGLHG